MPVREPEAHVGEAEDIAGRDDVEDGELRHALGPIERHPVRTAGAAIVSADEEAIEAELVHQSELVTPHRPLRVGLVVESRVRFRALAVAAQVARDDGEVLGKARRHLVPHHVCLGMAVKEQERRPAAAAADA